MKLLIAGCYGQLGIELTRQALVSGWEMKAVGRDEFDITDLKAVEMLVHSFQPEAVINAAAYTGVDTAESDAYTAFLVNRDGPKNLAMVCADSDIPLVHYSTDYVFDGEKIGAYSEDDLFAPLGVYGESKLAGENAVREVCSKYFVLRTSWAFSVHGHNFVKTMLRLGAEREEIGVVTDQFGKPTAASEIARLTIELLANNGDHWGTYHLAQPEAVSWHGFAKAILDEAQSQNIPLKVRSLKQIETTDYPTPATRPANSELNCDRFASVFGVHIRPWRESLAEVIKDIRKK